MNLRVTHIEVDEQQESARWYGSDSLPEERSGGVAKGGGVNLADALRRAGDGQNSWAGSASVGAGSVSSELHSCELDDMFEEISSDSGAAGDEYSSEDCRSLSDSDSDSASCVDSSLSQQPKYPQPALVENGNSGSISAPLQNRDLDLSSSVPRVFVYFPKVNYIKDIFVHHVKDVR